MNKPMKKVLNKDGLTLGFFIIKTQSRQLYRKYLRLIWKIKDQNLKKEILEQVNNEFRPKVQNVDEKLAKSYLVEGEKQYENLEKIVMMTNVQ